jgi:hypothetical protein
MGGHDGEGGALRYLAWAHDPDPADETFVVDHVYVLRSGAGEGARVEVVHDRHTLGLFPREMWLDLCREAGFRPEIRTVAHAAFGGHVAEVIVGRG